MTDRNRQPTAGSTLGNTIDALSLREQKRGQDIPEKLRKLGFDEKAIKKYGEILEKDGEKAAFKYAIDLLQEEIVKTQKQMDKIANDHLNKMRADLDRRDR